MTRRKLALLQGTLDMLLLRALTNGPQHGYALASFIRETTGGALEVEEGALYTSLHRMENRAWIEAEWGRSERNRRAKYYTLTKAGRRQLADETRTWTRYAEAVFEIIRATGGAAPSGMEARLDFGAPA